MLLTNNTASYLYFDVYTLSPAGGTATVPDADYNKDNLLADRINSMYAGGSVGVSSPPSGFPRDINLSGESSGGSFSGSAEDVTYDNGSSGLTGDDVQEVIDELAASLGGAGSPIGGIPFFNPITGWSAGNSSLGANNTEYNAFWVPEPGMTIKYVITNFAGASGNIDVGIYDSAGTGGAPGNLLVNTTLAHPGTGIVFITLAETDLPSGKYYVALGRSAANNHYYHNVLVPTNSTYPTWYGEAVYPLPAVANASVINHTVHYSFFALGKPSI